MKKLAVIAGAVLSLAVFAATPATAGLLGNTIEGAYYFPTDTSLYGSFSYSVNPFVVGAGVETVLTVDGFATTDVDFSDTALVLGVTADVPYTPASFNGPQFSVLSGDPFGSILSVIASGGQTVTAAIVAGVLQVNWQGQIFTSGDTITIEFGPTAVPEPGSLALLGAGLAGLALLRRRRSN